MYDSLFPEQTERSLLTTVPTRPEPRGMWANLGGALAAAPKVALAETARALEGVKGFMGLPDGRSIETFKAEVPSLSASMGQDIKRWTPDPEITGEASNIVFGFGKVIAKALPLGMVGGLPVAAAGTGLIEGTAEAQKLGDQGVDAKTAAKVGAIRGVATGVGIALPIAGASKLATAGLVLGGGPASFMIEQQASKMILDSADYAAIARQYNPFDPVGLTISALVPGAVAGVVHAGRARGARTAAAQASEAARVAQETLTANQKILDEASAASAADRGSVAASRADAEAAARALQMAEHIRNTGLRPEGDLSGATAHVDAFNQARAAMDAGEPVNAAAVVRKALDEQAARLSSEEKPGFLRMADEMVALKQADYPMLTPEIGRAFEIIQQPAFMRTAADRIFLERMLETEKAPPVSQSTTQTSPKIQIKFVNDDFIVSAQKAIAGLTEDQYILRINQEKIKRELGESMPVSAFKEIMPKNPKIEGSAIIRGGDEVQIVSGGEVKGSLIAVVGKIPVGYIAPEGGTTGLFVANKYRGRGIGEALSTIYRARDPFAKSGGFSESGEKTARKAFHNIISYRKEIVSRETTVKSTENQSLEHNVLAAREVAKAQPDMLAPDETTGTQVKASELVKKAEDDFARESNDAAAYLAAAVCGMRK
jgi:hypothetical protein